MDRSRTVPCTQTTGTFGERWLDKIANKSDSHKEKIMATAIQDLELELSAGDLETRYVEMGDMAIRHARVPAGTDLTPVLQGLPDDRCPSEHWGIILEGSIVLDHADGTQETAYAGEVYHWPAGHTAHTDGGAVFIEVGPVAAMKQFGDHAKKAMAGA